MTINNQDKLTSLNEENTRDTSNQCSPPKYSQSNRLQKEKKKRNVDSVKIRFAARRIQSVRYHSLTWPSSGGERCIFFFYTLIFGISLSGWLVVLVIYSYPKAKSGPLDIWIWIWISIYMDMDKGYFRFQIFGFTNTNQLVSQSEFLWFGVKRDM